MIEIIAEIGQNHNGDMALAKKLIWEAKENGADVAKFQLYDAKSLFPKEGNEWFDYNCKTEISREQLAFLVAECKKAEIEFMASVFDIERIGWLEAHKVKRHKVASRSIREEPLVRALTETQKPLLVSLGMWGEKSFPKIKSSAPVQFLYCISKYPTPLSDVKLGEIDFNQYAGFSDHTVGITAPMAAMARGAKIIEKHLTLDKGMYGPDHSGSMDLKELATLSNYRNELEQCLK